MRRDDWETVGGDPAGLHRVRCLCGGPATVDQRQQYSYRSVTPNGRTVPTHRSTELRPGCRNTMSSNIQSPTNSTDRDECPNCGGDVYYEPMLRSGTRHEFNEGRCSGYACLNTDCDWTETPSRIVNTGSVSCTECGGDVTRNDVRKHDGVCSDCDIDEFSDFEEAYAPQDPTSE